MDEKKSSDQTSNPVIRDEVADLPTLLHAAVLDFSRKLAEAHAIENPHRRRLTVARLQAKAGRFVPVTPSRKRKP